MALGDQRAVPAAAVLLVQRDQLAAGDPRRTPRLGEQHQREQAGDLGLVGQQRSQDPAQPDRLGGEVLADRGVTGGREVALVEDQVDHGEHPVEARRQVGRRGHPEGDVGVLDLLLRAGDPLRHRGLGDQERLGDLEDGQPAEETQGQRHPGLGCERGVAAGEDQPQPVVLDDAGRLVGCVVVQHQCRLVLGVAARLAPDPVDGPVAGRRGQPAARVGRYAVDRPPLQGDQQGVGGRLLGEVDVAEAADQRGDHAAVLLAVDPLDRLLGSPLRLLGAPLTRARPGRDAPRPGRRRPWNPRRPRRALRRDRPPR